MTDTHRTEEDVAERARKNGHLPAGAGETGVSGDSRLISKGLTKRERFAMAAMQGIFAHGYTMPNEGDEAAKYAVQAADYLLKELAK